MDVIARVQGFPRRHARTEVRCPLLGFAKWSQWAQFTSAFFFCVCDNLEQWEQKVLKTRRKQNALQRKILYCYSIQISGTLETSSRSAWNNRSLKQENKVEKKTNSHWQRALQFKLRGYLLPAHPYLRYHQRWDPALWRCGTCPPGCSPQGAAHLGGSHLSTHPPPSPMDPAC